MARNNTEKVDRNIWIEYICKYFIVATQFSSLLINYAISNNFAGK